MGEGEGRSKEREREKEGNNLEFLILGVEDLCSDKESDSLREPLGRNEIEIGCSISPDLVVLNETSSLAVKFGQRLFVEGTSL